MWAHQVGWGWEKRERVLQANSTPGTTHTATCFAFPLQAPRHSATHTPETSGAIHTATCFAFTLQAPRVHRRGTPTTAPHTPLKPQAFSKPQLPWSPLCRHQQDHCRSAGWRAVLFPWFARHQRLAERENLPPTHPHPRHHPHLDLLRPPSAGTGKTTVARRVGVLFESLGLLATSDIVCCSASDFTTGFANQSGGKTREVFEKAVGGVLFIDEAYRCAGVGR